MPDTHLPIEIPINKRNLAFMLLGAAGFVFGGLLLIILPDGFGLDAGRETLVRIIGGMTVLFFGLMGYWIGRRYLNERVGLRIDERGITDHSSGVSIGLIEWADIRALDTTRIGTERFLVLQTDHPEKYIDRAPNALVRNAMQANRRLTGSPLNLNARSLQISFEELLTTIREAWEHHR